MKTAIQLLLIAAGAFCGCATFTVAPGADPVIVYAEASAETSLDVFDAFLKWERNNEAYLLTVSPDIHATATEVRRSGKQWIKDLRTATKAYKENPTPDRLTALKLAQDVIDLLAAEVRQRTIQGKAGK